MTELQCLVCLWTLLISQTGFVRGDIRFLERREGDSVVLPCALEQRDPAPFGVYLRRSWLRPHELLFVYTGDPVSVTDDADKNRTSVSGDPSLRALNVTISQLRASDTDRYYCDFVVDNPAAEDKHIHGLTEFFLLVSGGGGDGHESVDMELVETCAGGSAMLPCFSPDGEGLAVEGVSLKRRRGRAPVEVLYNSKRHRSSSSRPPASLSQFPAERVQLSSAPSPGGLTYNLTLQQLQPEDSALYSCQLLLRDTPERSASLGRRVVFVSVKGEECRCSTYTAALYAVSSAVALFLLLLLVALAVIYKGKARRRVKAHPAAPIYEEMTGVQPLGGKMAPRHQEEMETSEYRNCTPKRSCPGNYYESPSGALRPSSESHT